MVNPFYLALQVVNMVYNPQSIGCQCLHGTLTTQLVDAIRTTARGVSTRQNTEPDARLAGTAVDADPLHGVIKIVGSAPEHEAAPDALLSDADKLMPCNAPVAAAFPVAPPVGADRLICDSTPFATVPAPENAVPVIGVIDNSWRPPDATPAPEAAPFRAIKTTGWMAAVAADAPVAPPVKDESDSASKIPLLVDAPVAPPVKDESDSASKIPLLVDAPDAAPDGAISDSVGKSPFAVEAPVADPVAADNEIDWRLPSAETADPEAAYSIGTAPISACAPSKKKRLYELYMSGPDYTQLRSDYWASAVWYIGIQHSKARSL